MEDNDKYLILSSFVFPALLWWMLVGRKKYGTPRGMK